jgi:tetratricopeptide (TPR) repeat protein
VLGELLATHDDYDVDRLLQVLFDLQAAGAHAQALSLFARVYAREDLDRQARREILYWKADSWQALGAHEDAARLFLRSATLGDPYSMDQWAQTARYQAAESLTRAGLVDDAMVLLNTLLHATDDPGRKAMLQHQLDQLARAR